MLSPFQLFVILLIPALASAQSIAGFISNVPGGKSYTLNNAAAAVANNPEWGTPGTKTLFVPADSANGPTTGAAGSIFVNDRAINYQATTQYQNIWDAAGRIQINYDNYCPACNNVQEVRVRDGALNGILIDSFQATNGYVYVMNVAFPRQSTLVETLAGRSNYSAFASLVAQLNLADKIASLPNATIFVPSNAALNAVASTLNTLTDAQKEAIIQNHIVPSNIYSTTLFNTVVQSYLGQSLTVAVGSVEGSTTINGQSLLIPADNFITNGVVHFIGGVLVPSPVPSAPAAWPNSASTTTSGSSSTSTSSGSPTPTGASGTTSNSASVGLLAMALGFIANLI